LSGISSVARRALKDEVKGWWEEAAAGLSNRYKELGETYTLKAPKELTLPRTTLHHFHAARHGHGDFAWYHRRFGPP
jgi:hypothetical protein